MRRAWVWLTDRLPERQLMAFDAVPFVVVTRQRRSAAERNAFELGRNYECGLTAERDADLVARLDACNAKLAELTADRRA